MSVKKEYRYQSAAREAATVRHVDEGRLKAFEAGVEWMADYFCRLLRPDTYEGVKGYPKDFLDGLTVKEMRKVFFELVQEREPVQELGP